MSIARNFIERVAMLPKDWKTYRPEGGLSYEDVISEVVRRADGEYRLYLPDRDRRLVSARERLRLLFQFSGLVHEFLRRNGKSAEDLARLFKDVGMRDAKDVFDILVSPFGDMSKAPERKDRRIEVHPIIDSFYPGENVERK